MIYTKHNNVTKNPSIVIKHLALLFLLGTAFSQAFAQYEMKKHTINSGGANMTGGNYELKSSIGQADASNTLSGGSFSLNGGFWQQNNDLIFKNDFE
ncbi:MAG: hypothetical protein L3J53_00765 [Proteobacteria bacterium]|nr:hypothetical protein [Pseudomonadota bacterium]